MILTDSGIILSSDDLYFIRGNFMDEIHIKETLDFYMTGDFYDRPDLSPKIEAAIIAAQEKAIWLHYEGKIKEWEYKF
jgi:hypothetical protein